MKKEEGVAKQLRMKKSDLQKIFLDARQSVIDGLRLFVSQSKDKIRLEGCSTADIDDDSGNIITTEFLSLEGKTDPETKETHVKIRCRSSMGYHEDNAVWTGFLMEPWELTADELYKIIDALPENTQGEYHVEIYAKLDPDENSGGFDAKTYTDDYFKTLEEARAWAEKLTDKNDLCYEISLNDEIIETSK